MYKYFDCHFQKKNIWISSDCLPLKLIIKMRRLNIKPQILILAYIFYYRHTFTDRCIGIFMTCLPNCCNSCFVYIKNVQPASSQKIAVGSVCILIMEKSAVKCVLATRNTVTLWMDAKQACLYIINYASHSYICNSLA